jgi:hypothetical protein
MAVTWGKGNPWPDKENKVTINGGSETEVTITVLAGAACGTYQVTYDNDATEPHCTGVTTFQVTGCGGGETCTLKITEANNTKTVSKDGNVDLQFSHSDIPIDCTIEGKSFAASDGGSTTTIGKVPGNTTGWVFDVVSDNNHMLNDTPIQASPSRDIVAFLNKNDSEGSVTRSARIKATCSGDNCRGCTEIFFEISQLGTSGPDNNHIRFIIRNQSVNGGNGTVSWEQAPIYYNGDVVAYYTADGNWRPTATDSRLIDADDLQLYLDDKPSTSTTCNKNYVFTQKKLDVGQSRQVDVAIGNGQGEIPSSALGKHFVKSGSQVYEESHYGGGNPAVKFATIVKAAEKLVEDNGDSRYGDISRCQRCVDYSRAYMYVSPIKDANGGGNTIIAGHTYYIDIFGTRVDKTPFINSTDTSYEIFNAQNRADATPPPICKFNYDRKCYKPAKRSDGKWATSTETQCTN